MPELPEVETILRGLQSVLTGTDILKVVVRCRKLRWLIADDFEEQLTHQRILDLSRRGKYLLLHLSNKALLIHLGMSGRLQALTRAKDPGRHDHVDILLSNQIILRYTDPRRFGALVVSDIPFSAHPLLKHLGVEPLSTDFDASYLLQQVKNRRIGIKPLLMNHQIVVGVGNIYANEALFLANINPGMPAHCLTIPQSQRLVNAIKQTLTQAIAQGGTTLKDFVDSKGIPGYFSQALQVYGRAGKPCYVCGQTLVRCELAQRTSVYCPNCQQMA